MENYTLSNGVQIPVIGYGTWQALEGETAYQAIQAALAAGYTHIDTAAVYGNEKSIGRAIKDAGVDRASLFITSKVWNTERGYEKTHQAFEKTLSDLGTDYLDLYLIHWPANAQQFPEQSAALNAETWRALEELYQAGRIKAIGVSNFLVHHLETLLSTAQIVPMVNQIEFHPGFMQESVVAFCTAHNILVQAWAPLGTGKMLGNETLISIANKYEVSTAQLCIKWCLQHGTLPLPKSVTPTRMQENKAVFDFTISDADMQTIDALPYIGGSGLNPDTIAF